MKAKKPVLVALVLGLCLSSAWSEGAGGILTSFSRPDWNPDFLPDPVSPYDLEFLGGFGYGVTDSGLIIGGFGFCFVDTGLTQGSVDWTDPHLLGGMGGVILGQRLVGTGLFHLDLAARLGIGGAYAHDADTTWVNGGFVVCYAEPYLELGIGLTPWMHLAASLGYEVIGNVITGPAFTDICVQTPSLGVSLSFGDFRRPWW